MEDNHKRCEEIVDYYINGIENNDQEVVEEIIEKIMDFEPTYKIRNGEVIGVEGYLGFGGPNIYLDTEYSLVEATWGDTKVSKKYEDAAGIHEILEETYNG